MGWLNPLNLIKIFTLIKTLIESVSAFVEAYKQRKREEESQKEIDVISDAEKKANSKQQEDKVRLKEKADAACEIETSFDSDSKC